ncbi:MAG: GNAT family N-acetyltransferase [Anaerolineae bacterium]|nr:GNAT family N-acetyltransferase [Anaerolineae bacterium]
MIQITPDQVTPALWALFDASALPAGFRVFAILEGSAAGQILTDDPANPSWCAVYEKAFGTIYPGGKFDTPLLEQLIERQRPLGDVLIGLWQDDPLNALLPGGFQYDGFAIDFLDRPVGEGLDIHLKRLPADCELRRIDRALFERSKDRDFRVSIFGSVEKALTRGLGFCLMRGDDILCDTYAGPAAQGIMEIGVETMKPHEGKGYATITCARLIQACEELGYRTYWNCAKQNQASAAIARKLGYRQEREYRLVGWL